MKEIDIRGLTDTFNRLDSIQNKESKNKGKDFEKILTGYLKQVNKLQLQSDKAVQQLAAGNNENIHETMIAIEKASISFQMMMQIRNKIIEAYDEIKRESMQ